MTERYRRCRFWPHCEIHLGDSRPRVFSRTSVDQMRAERAEGATLAEIAAEFETGPDTVARAVSR